MKKAKKNITSANQTKYHDLVPTIVKSDSFGKWSLDPLFGLLKIILIKKDKSEFPLRWRLEEVSYFRYLFKIQT